MDTVILGQSHLSNQPLTIPKNNLNNHCAIFGASGSGKTGQVISIIEQLIQYNVPLLIIDIKSDLTNLLQSEIRHKTHNILLTPGAVHGNTVDVFAKITDEKQLDKVIQSLLEMLGLSGSKSAEPYHTFLSSIIRNKYLNEDIELEELLYEIMNPSIKKVGLFDVDEALGPKARKELALKLNNIIANPSFDLWRKGLTLDFDLLFKRVDNNTPLVIYSVAHILDEKDKLVAITSVLSEYFHWTLKQSGSNELRSMIVIDECHGLMPPYPKNPSTKEPLLGLLKMGRAFGVGVLLATQNTKDIDYKGLANCGTWITGKLSTKNDRDRVIEGFQSFSGLDKPALHKRLGALQKREFMVAFSDSLSIVKSPDVVTPLQGPLSVQDLLVIRDKLQYYQVIECGDKKNMMNKYLDNYRKTRSKDWLRKIVGLGER